MQASIMICTFALDAKIVASVLGVFLAINNFVWSIYLDEKPLWVIIKLLMLIYQTWKLYKMIRGRKHDCFGSVRPISEREKNIKFLKIEVFRPATSTEMVENV
jgi:hypothetical protein